MIKSGGEWVSSLALESLASAVEGVGEVAAIGVPDPKWGERPLLLLVVHDEANTQKVESLVRAAFIAEIDAGRLSKWAMPRDFRFVTKIAKTSVGKIDKKKLRALFPSHLDYH